MGRRLLNLGLAIGIFVLSWIALAAALNREIMPYPWQVLPVFVEEMQGSLWDHTLVSARRVLSAIAAAVLLATPVGLGLGQIRVLNRIFSPLIALVHPIPKVVFLPIILVIMGIGETSKVFLIALILFFQILVVVRDEAASLRPEPRDRQGRQPGSRGWCTQRWTPTERFCDRAHLAFRSLSCRRHLPAPLAAHPSHARPTGFISARSSPIPPCARRRCMVNNPLPEPR